MNDAAPMFGLIVSVIAGAIAAANRRSGAMFGAIACIVLFLVWHLSRLPSSPTGAYAGAVAVTGMMDIVEGAIWGVIWGAVGGWIGGKFAGAAGKGASQTKN